jgi:carboxyl-terminal processing protease
MGTGLIFLLSFDLNDQESVEISKNLDIFNTLFKEVNKLYVEDLDPEKLLKVGIDGMLDALDPYTNYIPPDKIKDFRSLITGEYHGIGAEIDYKWEKMLITMIYEGYPAGKEGLLIGDQLLEVNGISVSNLKKSEVNSMLKGEVGSQVELKVERAGAKKPLFFKLKRENVVVNNIKYAGVYQKTGYIKLTEFTSGAGAEVAKAVSELKKQNVQGLILDLRDNPGGLLIEAINVVNVFIPKGKVVVRTRGKIQNYNKVYRTLDDPVDIDLPLVVLTNGQSASASEIVAGVIQDYDRGLIIGQKTYGKGLVQATRPLNHDSHLKITTAKYYMPSGRCIQINHNLGNDKVVLHHESRNNNSYYTSNGRKVNESRGIEPDLEVSPHKEQPIVNLLEKEGYIFNFASDYFRTHKNIESPLKFQLSDQNYEDFVKFMKAQGFSYLTESERLIARLVETSQNEHYFQQIREKLADVHDQVIKGKKNDLYQYKNEIRSKIEREIIRRYFLDKGMIEQSLKTDSEVAKANHILQGELESYYYLLGSNELSEL